MKKDPSAFSLKDLAALPREHFEDFLSSCDGDMAAHILHDWPLRAHAHQMPPDTDWLIWLLMGGRGCGKTRAGAEWVQGQVIDKGARRIALVAPTYTDAREVMLEGESGLLTLGYPAERPHYISSRRRLEWPNGAVGQIFTSEEPDGLRGPQFDYAWGDEFCAWTYPAKTLSNIRLALRLGSSPRLMITTTPKPVAALRALLKTPGLALTRASTADNQSWLAPNFIAAMQQAYGGTRIGRQELDGVLLNDVQGALWNYAVLERARITDTPKCVRIVVAIDPPVTSGAGADACGIIVAGLTDEGPLGRAIILHDGTVSGMRPQSWAQLAVSLYETWSADYILAEVNQGGEMVSTILSTVDARVPVRSVWASKSKTARAEPVAALYDQGRVKHLGTFNALEDELCRMGAPGGLRKSPDRADALVWAVTDLLLPRGQGPQIRRL